MSAQSPRKEPPALYLEQLLLGELDPGLRRALEDEFGAELLQARCAALREEDRALASRFEHVPSRQQLERYQQARARRRRRERFLSFDQALQRLVLAGGVLMAVVVAVVVVLPRQTAQQLDGADVEVTRVKGLSPRVLCFRRRGEVVQELRHGDQARAGDLIQLGYVAAGREHGVLLSIDGRGTVTRHFPPPPMTDTGLSRGSEQLLDQAYELDDAPDFERFIFVTSDSALSVGELERVAAELAADPERARRDKLSLPEGVEQVGLLLQKVSP